MSQANCNNKGVCAQTYFNYGSYMRARGNDKQICDLITAIENGSVVPYFVTHGGTIQGDVVITGNLTVGGELVIDGDVIYNGDVTFGDGCGDTLIFKGTPTFECPGTFESSLTVHGASDALIVTGGATRLEDATLSDALSVSGHTDLTTVKVSGSLGHPAAVEILGAAILEPGWPTVCAISTREHLVTSGRVYAKNVDALTGKFLTLETGTFNVHHATITGDVTIGGTLDVTGITTLAAADIASIGSTTPGTGHFTTLGASGGILSGMTIGLSTFTTGHINSSPIGLLSSSTVEASSIGANTPGTGVFTTAEIQKSLVVSGAPTEYEYARKIAIFMAPGDTQGDVPLTFSSLTAAMVARLVPVVTFYHRSPPGIIPDVPTLHYFVPVSLGPGLGYEIRFYFGRPAAGLTGAFTGTMSVVMFME